MQQIVFFVHFFLQGYFPLKWNKGLQYARYGTLLAQRTPCFFIEVCVPLNPIHLGTVLKRKPDLIERQILGEQFVNPIRQACVVG